MHYAILEVLKSSFMTLQAPVNAIPASDSPLLLWIRNQFLIINYLILLMVTNPIFLMIQLIYGDGAVFVTFWRQITSQLDFY